MKALLHSRVLLPVFNYVVLAFLEIGLLALQPLFYSMPFELGGLALRPQTIGYILGAFGATNGIFQFFFFPLIVGRFTPKPVFIAGIVLFIPIFCLFPVMNTLARSGAPAIYVWIVLVIQLGMCVVMDMSYCKRNIASALQTRPPDPLCFQLASSCLLLPRRQIDDRLAPPTDYRRQPSRWHAQLVPP